MSLPRRTEDYLENGAAVSRRNDELFLAAQQLRDAGKSKDEAEQILLDRGGRDQLPESEIRKTVASAYSRPAREPIQARARPPVKRQIYPPKSSAPPMTKPQYDLNQAETKIPEPLADGARKLLQAAFKPGEGIDITTAQKGDDGKEIPGSAQLFPYEFWMKCLDENGGKTGLSNDEGTGLYICINPLSGKRKDENVSAFRHALVEFDHIPKEQQWALIQQSGIPCTAIVDSGGRSIHAWVKIEANSREQYDQRVKFLFEHFAEYGLDKQNKNPSRLCRFVNCPRGDKRQELLALNVGAASFLKWQADNQPTFLPPILDVASELVEDLPEPMELVAGVLHQGSKMVIGGGSKSFKTWSLLDLALSVATGSPWWGFDVRQGRVLYINFEIQRPFFRKRLETVMKAKSVALAAGQLDHWPLRGYAADLAELKDEILSRIRERQYVMVVVDPIYKAMGGADENKAGDVGHVLNEIESIAVNTGAAVAFGAHFSKGNQSGKESIDRISGSGVFARDPDTILVMTPHQNEGAFTVDITLRNFPPIDPFVLAWQHPLMRRTNELDPGALKLPRQGKAKREPTEDEFLSLFPAQWPETNPREALMNTDQLRAAFKRRGFDKDVLTGLRDTFAAKGVIGLVVLVRNEKLVGRPAAVQAFETWRKEQKAAQEKKEPEQTELVE